MLYSEFIAPHVEKLRLSTAARRGLSVYLARLERQGLPPILSLQHLASETGLSAAMLASIIHDPDRYYKEKLIPKRRGGHRVLSVPRPHLMHLQRWILTSILEKVPVHPAAHGFVKGRGILSNATGHLGAEKILKMDIRGFFPSVPRSAVERLFADLGYSPALSYSLSRLVTTRNHLPQGAPTSPALSNLLVRDLDDSIDTLCSARGLRYQRYADDICVSGNEVGIGEIEAISVLLLAHGFAPAEAKTRLATRGQKMIVTGVSISSGAPRLPREMRRRLRQTLHYIDRYGLRSHQKAIDNRDPIYRFRLAGSVLHWLHIEPDNQYARAYLALLRGSKESPSAGVR